MTEDRHGFDPYAPPPPLSALTGVVQPPASDDATTQSASTSDITTEPVAAEPVASELPIPGDLTDITRADLITLAEQHGVPSYGTKAEIADRIRRARAGNSC